MLAQARRLLGGLDDDALAEVRSLLQHHDEATAGDEFLSTPAELDEAALERRLLGRSATETRVVEADFARVHIEMRRKGVTLMLLWQEYRAAYEGRRTWAYTQFCEHYKAFARTLKRSMRQQRRADAGRMASGQTGAQVYNYGKAAGLTDIEAGKALVTANKADFARIAKVRPFDFVAPWP